jgi:phage terminase Nu1 subunit (DNA packaging protein)
MDASWSTGTDPVEVFRSDPPNPQDLAYRFFPRLEPRERLFVASVDVARVAQLLNLQVRRVQYLVKEGMPREARGKYDPMKCMLWYVRYLQRLLEKKALPQCDVSEREERVRLLRAKADIRELELSRKRSQLISIADCQTALANLVNITTVYITAVAPRLAPELVGETSRLMIQAKIEKAHKEALSNLPKTGGRLDNSVNAQASTLRGRPTA